ncbi:MAG: sulfatase-like hydrolase/transferase, partial [Opitutales bacterium]|nr:sulfatase-like hydrolase/transferase [Opitutales bacterium]
MRNIVLLSVVSFLFCSVNTDAAKENAKPNVILVLVDDMGWMDLSCQGSDFYRTPNVDRLAKEGIRFTNGYAACAVCSPTRAAVQTGRYPHRL